VEKRENQELGNPPKVPGPPLLLPSQPCLIWSGGVRVWHVHRVLRADDAVSVIDLLVVMSHPAPAGGVSGRSADLRYYGGERCGTRTLVSTGDVSPIAVFVSGSVPEG